MELLSRRRDRHLCSGAARPDAGLRADDRRGREGNADVHLASELGAQCNRILLSRLHGQTSIDSTEAMNKFLKLINRIAHAVTGKHVHDFKFPGALAVIDNVPMIVQTCSICGEQLETPLK